VNNHIHRKQNIKYIFIFLIVFGCVFYKVLGCQDKSQALPKYNFSTDWFSQEIPSWEKHLSQFKGTPNIHYLEIGVYEGRSVIWMLENILTHPTSKVTCIDLFPEEIRGIENLKERFFSNLKASGFGDKVTTIEGKSQIELKHLSPNSFDIIYIDGSHIADDVLADAVLSWPLLKYDGIIIFDDYLLDLDLPVELRPQLAIDAFITTHRNLVEQIYFGSQVILKKVKPVFSSSKYFFPIGQYVYLWRQKKLYVAKTKEPIKLSDKEKELIERLIKSRKFGEINFSPDNGILKDEDFLNLKKRLELRLELKENIKSKQINNFPSLIVLLQ